MKIETKKELISVARKIINNEIDLVNGSREIVNLTFEESIDDFPCLRPFITVDSETEHFPLDPKMRETFGLSYLNRLDEEKESTLLF